MNRKLLTIALIAVSASLASASPALQDAHATSVLVEDASIVADPSSTVPDTFRVTIDREDKIIDDQTGKWVGTREVELILDVDVSRDGVVKCNGVIVPEGITRAILSGTKIYKQPVSKNGQNGVFESNENKELEKVMEKGVVDVGFQVNVAMLVVESKVVRRSTINVVVFEVNGEKAERNQVLTEVFDAIIENGQVVRRPVVSGDDVTEELDFEAWQGIEVLPDQLNEAVEPVSAMSVPKKVKYGCRRAAAWFRNQTPFIQFLIVTSIILGSLGSLYAFYFLGIMVIARFRQRSYKALESSSAVDTFFTKA